MQKLNVVVHTFILSTQERRQIDLYELNDSLVYTETISKSKTGRLLQNESMNKHISKF